MRLIIIRTSVFWAFLWAAHSQPSAPVFLRPVQNSILDSGQLVIVARAGAGATLTLDGSNVAATSPGPNALTATVDAKPGRHELTLRDSTGSSTVSFLIRASASTEAPEGWKPFRVHPPAALKAACQTCHAVKNGQWSFAGNSVAASCAGCHPPANFSKTHTHEVAVLRDCQICHSTHGSTEPAHLKLPPKAACEQCHPL